MKNKTAFLPIRVSVFICGFPNEQIRLVGWLNRFIYRANIARAQKLESLTVRANPFWQSYISAACADRHSSICLASQYTRRFCARGDGMPPCCLATGRWGDARRRLDTGIARDPAPLPPAWSYEESTGWHDGNKSLLQKRQTSLCPGHEWLAIAVLWFHWNVFILATATSTFEQRNSARNGSDRASDWSYQESTSCHKRKKSFFVP